MPMKTMTKKFPGSPRNTRQARTAKTRFTPRLDALEARLVLSTLTVLNNLDSGPGSLRATIAAASDNDQIVFAPALSGQTITLTTGELVIDKDLTIQGPGQNQLAISGNNASRVFHITGKDSVEHISLLTIKDGLSTRGGGIRAVGASLTLTAVAITGNSAVGTDGPDALGNTFGGEGRGGGLDATEASVVITACTVSGNIAIGGAPATDSGAAGGGAFGGGAAFSGGVIVIDASTFDSDQAGGPPFSGQNGGAGASFGGGGIFYGTRQFRDGERVNDFSLFARAKGDSISLTNDTLSNNSVVGGLGDDAHPNGSDAFGGALDANVATATLTGCTFESDIAQGGFAAIASDGVGGGAFGGGAAIARGSLSVARTTFDNNGAFGSSGGQGLAKGTGGNGGAGEGGGLYYDGASSIAPVVKIDGGTFTFNFADGGTVYMNGGVAGLGAGGGLAILAGQSIGLGVTLTGDTFEANETDGGSRGIGDDPNNGGYTGGAARGAGVFQDAQDSSDASFTLARNTFDSGIAAAGTGKAMGGAAQGAGVANEASFAANPAFLLSANSFTNNNATGGDSFILGRGGKAEGGALWNDANGAASPRFIVATGAFSGNSAVGGSGGFAGHGSGGAIFNDAANSAGAIFTVDRAVISGNHATGGAGTNQFTNFSTPQTRGGDGGTGSGGGIANVADLASGPVFTFTRDVISRNTATGGAGGHGPEAPVTGDGGDGGDGDGGGISSLFFSGSGVAVTIARSSLANNQATGGLGGAGGNGDKGGKAGKGGNGGGAHGGGIYVEDDFGDGTGDTVTLDTDTLTGNKSTGGGGGAGGAGVGPTGVGGNGGFSGVSQGGGLWSESSGDLILRHTSISRNRAASGAGGQGGVGTAGNGTTRVPTASSGGGVWLNSNAGTARRTKDSKIVGNQADTNPDVFGTFIIF